MILRRTLAIVCFVLVATRAWSAATPRDAYVAALAREQAVRAALLAPAPPTTVARDARSVVTAYQTIVRRYPTSGYADNALWQGGRLSLDLFLRFNQPRDRTTGVHLLRSLTTAYPTSKLVKQVPEQLARIATVRAGTSNDSSRRPSAQPGSSAAEPSPPVVGPMQPVPALTRNANPTLATVPSAPVATLKAVRRAVLADTVRIIIEFDGEVSFRDERMPNPLRVFIDLPLTRAAPILLDRTVRFDGDTDIVRQVHVGQSPNSATRVVVDAAGVSSYSVYPLYSPYRLVIDCVRGAEPQAAAQLLASRTLSVEWGRALPLSSARQTAAIVSAVTPVVAATPALRASPLPRLPSRPLRSDWGRALPGFSPGETALIVDAVRVVPPALPAPLARRVFRSTDWGRLLPAVSPRSTGLIVEALREVVPPVVETPPSPVEGPVSSSAVEAAPSPPKRLTGGYSMARQLGLGVSRIVIDPGHGGHDPGAQGKSIDEAGLVLDVAMRLEKLLQATPGTEVILTRRTDAFVSLTERTAIANRENADLFLSIHANASESPAARGVETYFLNFATNMSAASVAARENAASGQSMAALPDLVKSIALNNKLDESRDFAGEVQRAMVDRLRPANKTVKDLGVKQAPFAVLIGAAMPSVLAEISFVTNAQEEKLLLSSTYRQRIAEALYTAVHKYQLSLGRNTALDN